MIIIYSMDKSREEQNNNRYQSITNNNQLPNHNFVFNPNSNIISNNPFNTTFNNPFLLPNFYYNPFMNPLIYNNPNINVNNTDKISHFKRTNIDNDDDLKDLKEPLFEKVKFEDLKKIEPKSLKIKKEKTTNNKYDDESSENEEINNNYPGIYVYIDNDKNKYLYVFHKKSQNTKIIELRCKDRKNCKGRAQYNLETEEIKVTIKCTIDKYENHNYLKSQIIKDKINKDIVTKEEMKEPEFQKYYFTETHSKYPSLSYNEILVSLVNKFEVQKIYYTSQKFSNYKTKLNRAYIYSKNNIDKLNDIKLFGKNLLICYMKFKDIQTDNYKTFRIYATDLSLSLLNNKNINQYFIDTTYKCVPNDIDEAKSLLIIIGYNNSTDKFELILASLLSKEDSDTLVEFYSILINSYNWNPKCITLDFALSNINAIKKVFSNSDIKIIPCLFHLLQSWWRKAANIGLRKKKYLNDTKVLLFNLELICFMDIKTARKHYSNIIKNINRNDKFDQFIDYFERTWFPVNDSDVTKYDFNLWNYSDKFNFKGNKNQLIKKGELHKYILFSNNAVESFNHLMNQCLEHNNKVSISKFIDILKFIFIRMSSNKDTEEVNVNTEQRTLISDILRELVELGYGKNDKMIDYETLKKLKYYKNEDVIFNLTFTKEDDGKNSDDE